MSQLKIDGERVEVQRALEPLTNAIVTDSRVFHLTTSEWISQLNKQLNAEVIGFGGWRDAEPIQIISEAKERLKKEGWNKVRPALSVTIRAFILYAFAGGKLTKNHTSEVQYLRRAIDIIERGQKEWEHVRPETRGSVFRETFKRGVDRMYMDALRDLCNAEADPSVREQISDEIFDKATAMIKSINSSPPPPRGVDPPFVNAFYYHARGHAQANQGWCYKRRGSQPPLAKSKEGLQLLRQAGICYLKAAGDFPEDDEWHIGYLTIAVENMLEGAAAVGEVLRALKRLRSAIPKAEMIWASLMSKYGHQERSQRVLSYEPKLRQLLNEGKITENYGMCITLAAVDAGVFGDAAFSVDLDET
ncbi:hypothetical protein L218DRAFT_933775 [Marasmius fiardii PR-910]|nr:hypothetical protein L218DRAFT_933775 [Marasmius fiardii PR-910]